MSINTEICKKFTGTFLLLCLVLLSLQALSSYSPGNSSLVYCPLQKQWVKGGEKVFITKDFNDFCATDKRKKYIKSKIYLKIHFSQIITENLVFGYLEKRNQGFVLLNHLPDFPPREHIKKSSTITATNSFFDFSIKIAPERFSLNRPAHPPAFTAQTYFGVQFVRVLNKISRNINPRSPPLFT